MEKENLLLTRIFLSGKFWDVALYSGILYLWKDKQTLELYHWNKWAASIAFADLPIYQFPSPVQGVEYSLSDLQPYYIKEILFPKKLRDFFLYRHQLFFIDEDGFFVLLPESALPVPTLLVSGDFHSLSLSEKNRAALSAGEQGVYEYMLTNRHEQTLASSASDNFRHVDPAATYSVTWNGQKMLQRNQSGEVVQLLDFQYLDGKILLAEKRPRKELVERKPYYYQSLNLKDNLQEEWSGLFQYLPSQKTTDQQFTADAFLQKGVPLAVQPCPYFDQPVLDDGTLYIEEKEEGLLLLLKNQPYLHIPQDDYCKWRIYPKSRNYQNHLHLLAKDKISFLLFHELN